MNKAKDVDANDPQIKKELEEIGNATMFERLLKERSEQEQFDSAVLQTSSLIEICTDSAHFHAMKIKMLVKAK
jgi:hypothetical protein